MSSWREVLSARALLVASALLLLPSRSARVKVEEAAQRADAGAWEDLDLDTLARKQGSGDDATFDVSVAGGNAIGRLHVALTSLGSAPPRLTNQGFADAPLEDSYWAPGSILGKDDDAVWPISPEGSRAGPMSFVFDHGVSDLVFGDLLGSDYVFHRMEFDELVYRKVQAQRGPFFAGYPSSPGYQDPFQQTADEAVSQHLREEEKDSTLTVGRWHRDGYFTPGPARLSYTPRLRAKKQFWEDAGGRFRSVAMQRPAIMDIDNLFVDDPDLAGMVVRTSVDVNKDAGYQGGPGRWPSLGKCRASKSLSDRLLRFLSKHVQGMSYFCGRNADEQCSSKAECDALGGRWKEKYCSSSAAFEACGCCKEIGSRPPPRGSGVSAQMYVEWLAPLLRKHSCVPLEARWAKAGASSVFIAMGWGTEGDVESLDIDLSLVPLTREKRVVKDKIVYFNSQVPRSLACHSGERVRQGEFAMRAFADDRSGDSPGDDEMVKVNLACLAHEHPDIDAVVVMANIYKPRGLTWNMLDSVYMRFIAGGQERRHGDNFFVQDAESIASFVRLTADAVKADPNMENEGLLVGMLFKDAEGTWAFAGLMEGVTGQTAFHSAPQIERVLQGFSYPVGRGWSAGADAAADGSAPQGKCVEPRVHGPSDA